MSKPNGLLHGVVAVAVIPRTRANSACGLPVIHGSIRVGATTGLVPLVEYTSPLSRKLELAASWNGKRMAQGTGFQAKDGGRVKELSAGSSARSRKPCRFFGAAPRTGFAASAAGASVSKPRQTATSRGARSIVLCGCRQPPPLGCPSNEGCQPGSGRQNKRVGAGPSHQLDRRREAVLGSPARQGEGGPAECVERERVRNQPLPQDQVTDARGRCDALQRRREQQVDPVEQLQAALAVLRSRLPGP